MKAQPVEGLEPAGPMAEQVEKIVAVRLAELESFVPAVLDPEEVRALHDMRIAAKRLRYILEATAQPCFGPYAAEAGKRAKDLQDLLGEIHDCDVLEPELRRLLRTLRREDAEEARRRAAGQPDLGAAEVRALPHADARPGLETLRIQVRARRAHLFERFLLLWRDLEREGFASRLRYAITERPTAH